jgi:hypothetical protein
LQLSIVPYHKLNLETSLSPSEIATRLFLKAGNPKKIAPKHLQFVGEVTPQGFRFYRVTPQHSAIPLGTAKVIPNSYGGSHVVIVFQLYPIVIPFMVFWTFFWAVLAYIPLASGNSDGVLCFGPIFFLYLAHIIPFNVELVYAKRFIAELIKPE